VPTLGQWDNVLPKGVRALVLRVSYVRTVGGFVFDGKINTRIYVFTVLEHNLHSSALCNN
jgi:Flp pilus assembly protein CpaB